MTPQKSACCNASAKVVSSEDSTFNWECLKCGSGCDIAPTPPLEKESEGKTTSTNNGIEYMQICTCGISCPIHYERAVREARAEGEKAGYEEAIADMLQGGLLRNVRTRTLVECVKMLEEASGKVQGGGNGRRIFAVAIEKIKAMK